MEEKDNEIMQEYFASIKQDKGDNLKTIFFDRINNEINQYFEGLKTFKKYQIIFDNWKREFDLEKKFGELACKTFNLNKEYSDYILSFIEPLEKIDFQEKIIFNRWDDYILNNWELSDENFLNGIMFNLCNIGIQYKKYLIKYYSEYASCPYSQVRKYFEVITIEDIKEHFYYTCRLINNGFYFDEKENELSTLKLILKISMSELVDVSKSDIDEFHDYFKYGPYDKYADRTLLIHAIIQNIEKRVSLIESKDFRLISTLTINQIEVFSKNIDFLFDDDTTMDQLKGMFNADFDFLHRNPIALKPSITLTSFGYLLNEFEKCNLFNVHEINNTFSKYKWLINKKGNRVLTKSIQDARVPKYNTKDAEYIDDLIEKLKNTI
ncbi:MAG TPA: hypothetical protein DCG75_15430 [Bacteroidales bacterium]|nr:hypothetical protein [Bacteroidales bacterium]